MYCSNCGNQLEDNTEFCPYCGAPQTPVQSGQKEWKIGPKPSKPSRPAKPASSGAKTAGSFVKRVVFIVLALILGRTIGYAVGSAMAGGSSSSSSGSGTKNESPTLNFDTKDLLTEHKVVKLDEGDGCYAYQTIFYGHDSHIIKALFLEFVYDKEMGYKLEDINQDYLKNLLPSFAEFSYEDGDKYLVFTAKMKDLENKDRIKALADTDIIELTGSIVPSQLDADTLYNSCLENGWVDAPLTDYSFLHFTL